MIRNQLSSTSSDNIGQYEFKIKIRRQLHRIGIELNIDTGHLFYSRSFKPFNFDFELVFVRHGETYGNCGQSTKTGKIDTKLVSVDAKDREKRIFQGDIDTEINQLTAHGKQQALEVGEKLKNDFLDKGWDPDIIFISPLSRAKLTALPFILKNSFKDRSFIYDSIKEISFGSWENRRICDIDANDDCHLFYRNQHALIKSIGIDGNHTNHQPESFCDVLLRANNVLSDINVNYPGKKILMFSHSIFGSACLILAGRGQKVENGEHLAFDGRRKDGSYYAIPNATPFLLNTTLPSNQKL
jgi:broad specificity phosphatase PhoE